MKSASVCIAHERLRMRTAAQKISARDWMRDDHYGFVVRHLLVTRELREKMKSLLAQMNVKQTELKRNRVELTHKRLQLRRQVFRRQDAT
jgi:hypothetical protein